GRDGIVRVGDRPDLLGQCPPHVHGRGVGHECREPVIEGRRAGRELSAHATPRQRDRLWIGVSSFRLGVEDCRVLLWPSDLSTYSVPHMSTAGWPPTRAASQCTKPAARAASCPPMLHPVSAIASVSTSPRSDRVSTIGVITFSQS